MVKAVIELGGQQHLVEKGDEIVTDFVDSDKKSLTLTPLMVIDGDSVEVGNPEVKGATVKLEVGESAKGDKVQIMKFQAKKRVKTLTGHRQLQTRLSVKAISVK